MSLLFPLLRGTFLSFGCEDERYEDLVVVPMLWSDFNQLTDKQLYARLYKEGLPASEAPHLDLCLFLKFAETPMMNRYLLLACLLACLQDRMSL